MKRDHIEFEERSTARGYLITFRCYGSWFHGDEKGSVDRRHHNAYGTAKIRPAENLRGFEKAQIKGKPVRLDARMRMAVKLAIEEVCKVRGYTLLVVNVRTNHVHVVVLNSGSPERIMDSFKAYATRALREAGLVGKDAKVWSRHGSTRYLWTEAHLDAAVDYVHNGQGRELPSFD